MGQMATRLAPINSLLNERLTENQSISHYIHPRNSWLDVKARKFPGRGAIVLTVYTFVTKHQ